MPANVETMFYAREKPWHGLGTEVQEAPTSADALIYAGLDWLVEQKNVYTEDGSLISGYKVNTRSTDNTALGIVSDRYKVVQNEDAFQFTDDLLGAGVTYETAGALQGGRKVWMLARMPHRYIIAGDEIAPYLVVMNSHDGSSGIKVAMTPNAFQLFPQVMIMTDGGPNGATQVMVERIYRYGFRYFRMGYAAAFSWILFVIIMACTAIQMKAQKRWVNYDA